MNILRKKTTYITFYVMAVRPLSKGTQLFGMSLEDLEFQRATKTELDSPVILRNEWNSQEAIVEQFTIPQALNGFKGLKEKHYTANLTVLHQFSNRE
jgi:hypothetical protein